MTLRMIAKFTPDTRRGQLRHMMGMMFVDHIDYPPSATSVTHRPTWHARCMEWFTIFDENVP